MSVSRFPTSRSMSVCNGFNVTLFLVVASVNTRIPPVTGYGFRCSSNGIQHPIKRQVSDLFNRQEDRWPA